jgi:endogenous inhibitor of DNA gyrase (YacG/DUF329 family)
VVDLGSWLSESYRVASRDGEDDLAEVTEGRGSDSD